jgi:hypothetical protein
MNLACREDVGCLTNGTDVVCSDRVEVDIDVRTCEGVGCVEIIDLRRKGVLASRRWKAGERDRRDARGGIAMTPRGTKPLLTEMCCGVVVDEYLVVVVVEKKVERANEHLGGKSQWDGKMPHHHSDFTALELIPHGSGMISGLRRLRLLAVLRIASSGTS